MLTTQRTCVKCDDEFTLTRDKPGRINECPKCSVETVEKLGGNMIYEHKTAPYIEVKSMYAAKAFAKATRRHGATVATSLCESREFGLSVQRADSMPTEANRTAYRNNR